MAACIFTTHPGEKPGIMAACIFTTHPGEKPGIMAACIFTTHPGEKPGIMAACVLCGGRVITQSTTLTICVYETTYSSIDL